MLYFEQMNQQTLSLFTNNKLLCRKPIIPKVTWPKYVETKAIISEPIWRKLAGLSSELTTYVNYLLLQEFHWQSVVRLAIDTEAFLEPCQTCRMKLFCESIDRLLPPYRVILRHIRNQNFIGLNGCTDAFCNNCRNL